MIIIKPYISRKISRVFAMIVCRTESVIGALSNVRFYAQADRDVISRMAGIMLLSMNGQIHRHDKEDSGAP